jgi:hypothetical protein
MNCVDCKNVIFSLGDVLCPKTGEVLVALGEKIPSDLLEECVNQDVPDHLVPAEKYHKGFPF